MIERNNIDGTQYSGDNNFRTIEIRLNTDKIIERIEMFLKGSKIISYYDQNQQLKSKELITGVRKCNDEGIQSILNFVNGIINPQTVQGNFPSDKQTGRSQSYDDFIEEYNKDLASYVVLNCYDWDIKDDDLNGIIDFIMSMVRAFMTRLIDNEERKSYGETMKSIERSVTNDKKGFLGLNT